MEQGKVPGLVKHCGSLKSDSLENNMLNVGF